jgi:hypothetical protein
VSYFDILLEIWLFLMNHPLLESIKDRYINVKDRIAKAAARSNRAEGDVCLVAVTKMVPVEAVKEVIALGVRNVGESRIQEAESKFEGLSADGVPLQFHLVGQLQTNKVRKAVELFDLVQSVDRPRLASFLNRVAGEMGTIQRCLIEVKMSPEDTKSGIPLELAPQFIAGFGQYHHLQLEGLMTIAPFGVGAEVTRECFRSFQRFFEAHRRHLGENPVLSMGMTDDFEIAIEEGSTMVRIGRGIFGERR